MSQQPHNRLSRVVDQLAAMQKLDWLIGNWSGTSWINVPGGKRGESLSGEIVEQKLDGLILQVEGLHTQTPNDQSTSEQVNLSTVALISFDDTTGTYRFDSYTHGGDYGMFDAKLVSDNTFRWATPQGNKTIRYDITRRPDGSWFEVGEISPDGQTWHQFFEMTLQKTD